MGVAKALLILSAFALAACNNVAELSVPAGQSSSPLVNLVWDRSSPTILAGEEITFSFSNGTPNYVTDANGVGTFSALTLLFVAPVNLSARDHTIFAQDAAGLTGSNLLRISGFAPRSTIGFPLTYGDQNYPSAIVATAAGNVFVSAIIIDALGWERWAIYRSSDLGATWALVDQYINALDAESHPLGMVAKNNDVYACGYEWVLGVNDLAWVIRKSSDQGSTWSTVDYLTDAGQDHHCYHIALSPTTGSLVAVGSRNGQGIIRESTDDGASWTTVGTFPGVFEMHRIDFSPAGVAWVAASDDRLYKGVFSLGVWNWTQEGVIAANIAAGAYQLMGDFEIISETEAFYSSRASNRWMIQHTTDGGATWANSFTGALNTTEGQDILRLPSGELLAIGTERIGFQNYAKILRSSDGGATWAEVYSDPTLREEGALLFNASNGLWSVTAYDVGYQMQVRRSVDEGDTWVNRSQILFLHGMWTEIYDFARDGLGNLWATGYLNYIDENLATAWGVVRSTDNGVTWTSSDVFTSATEDLTAMGLAIGPLNRVYAVGFSESNFIVRESLDSGATWNEIQSYNPPGNTNFWGQAYITVGANGDVFYTAADSVGGVKELRRGASNGTVWTTVSTFPQAAGSTNFNFRRIKSFSDGSLWVLGTETNNLAVAQTVIYRSTDAGVSFTEVFRGNGTVSSGEIKRHSSGDVYVTTPARVRRTPDNGVTWLSVYDGTLTGNPVDFDFDVLGRVFVATSTRIYTRNQFDFSWFHTYDIDLSYPDASPEFKKLANCGNTTRLCAVGLTVVPYDGYVHQILPLENP